MNYLKRKAIRLLPLLVLPLSLSVIATRVKSAAEFPAPCWDDAARTRPSRQTALLTPKVVDHNLTIFSFESDGIGLRLALSPSHSAAR